MSEQDTFIPEDAEAKELEEKPVLPPEYKEENLADDKELVKEVLKHIETGYQKYVTDRSDLEDIWDAIDYMKKCGQNETIRETERARLDRNSTDNMTKTKSRKCGSTLFWRQVKTNAAILIHILKSKRDPFLFKPRYNSTVWASSEQADEQAEQHNALMRWTRDADDFDIKSIEIAFDIFSYGNQPIYVGWKNRSANILDRDPKTGRVARKRVLVDYFPYQNAIPNDHFYADQNIHDIQKQNLIVVKSPANIGDFLAGARDGEYLNVDDIDDKYLYKGTDSERRENREANAGFAATTSDSNTGLFVQLDAHALLPIDENKPKGERWDAKEHTPEKYWVTICTSQNPQDGVCLRIKRNDDPDDDYPFAMIRCFPTDPGKLYCTSLGQILRGNYTEATTSKQQMLDHRSVSGNKPLKVRSGAVHMADGSDNYTFGPDKQYMCDDPSTDIQEFQLGADPDAITTLRYLDEDSDEAAGTGRVARGEPMGGRTSASEAEVASEAAGRPHFMIIKYILQQWLIFYAQKCVRRWHIYGKPEQILQISDEERYPQIHPAELFGDFDIELVVVDEYEKNLLQRQNFTYAVQNMFPVFAEVLDLPKIAVEAFDKMLNWDISKSLKRDTRDESRVLARAENRLMMEGKGDYVPPTDNEDFDVMLEEHKGERLQYLGIEDENPNVRFLDRHIAETEFRKTLQPTILPGGSPTAPPQNETVGEAAGNRIAAERGAAAGG